MGNQPSRLYGKLWHCLPNPDNSSSWFDSKSKPFTNHEDKDQFVHATIVVLSQNGAIDLGMHDCRLLYSRRDNDQMVARIVAEKDGIVKAQIAARDDGKDQNEAFKALRRHVERCLDSILKDVPGSSYNGDKADFSAGPSQQTMGSGSACPISPRRTESSTTRRPSGQALAQVPVDAPPAYGKAVRDWRSGSDEKK